MKRYSSYIPVVGFAFLFILFSCKKDIKGYPPPDQYKGDDFNQVFEAFWEGMNNNYVFWSIDTVDWDRMYEVYKPKFAELDMNDMMDVRKSVTYFREMTKNLTDSHLNISFNKLSMQVSPSIDRKRNKIFTPLSDSFFIEAIYNNYLDKEKSWGTKNFIDPITEDNAHLLIITGTIQHKILYLHTNCFFLEQLHDSVYIAPVWKKFYGLLHSLPANFKGLILDLRSNRGGSTDDLNFIAGKLIDHPIRFGYTRGKSNIGRLDYTPWAPAIVTPDTAAVIFSQPIVVLTDQNSISMAEITPMALKQLPNTRIIGDTTWGATGPLSSNFNRDNGGQFHFANFGFVYTSSVQFKYINEQIYEGKGFPPDEFVPINNDSVRAGSDVQLTAAIKYLMK